MGHQVFGAEARSTTNIQSFAQCSTFVSLPGKDEYKISSYEFFSVHPKNQQNLTKVRLPQFQLKQQNHNCFFLPAHLRKATTASTMAAGCSGLLRRYLAASAAPAQMELIRVFLKLHLILEFGRELLAAWGLWMRQDGCS